MTAHLQNLIHSAEQLTPIEQVELINAISGLLYRHYRKEQTPVNFWQPQDIASIIASQGSQPVSDISSLKASFWPDDETADDIVQFVEQQRQEDQITN
ncbi:hypothetical protein GC175_23100 [bacterium]|nr:hypothetical protein [bacterium]